MSCQERILHIYKSRVKGEWGIFLKLKWSGAQTARERMALDGSRKVGKSLRATLMISKCNIISMKIYCMNEWTNKTYT